MGRKKLNRTKTELNAQAAIRSLKYYYKNKEECNRKAMERYWKKKALLMELNKINNNNKENN